MSDEIKTEKVSGQRGEIGTASTSLKMKQRWALEGAGTSLKQFARKLLKDNDELAETWFANKDGFQNQVRSDANKALAKLCASATKMEKRKPKSSNKPSKT